MIKLTAIFAIVLLAAPFFQPPVAQAQTASYSPLALVYVGTLIVNGGAALANGFALSMGRPDRLNGQFGLVLGAVSMLAACGLYAMDHDYTYSEEAALMLGGAGLASALAGGFAIRAADRQDEAAVLYPVITPQRRGVSVGVRMQF